MSRPIGRLDDLIRGLERYRKKSFIKIKAENGQDYPIKRVKRIGTTVQILI